MKHVFYRIDNLKIVFIKYTFQNTVRDEHDENKTHFNIFKRYIIVYYMTFIRLYDDAQNFDSTYESTIHKFLLKIFLVTTNITND